MPEQLPIPSSRSVSDRMSKVRRRDTTPELALRRALFVRGFRYRVAYAIPGKPRRSIDIAFPGLRIAVFVDGCFWHGCTTHKTIPQANHAWWTRKIDATRQRDIEAIQYLDSIGWESVRFWEHDGVEEMLSQLLPLIERRRRD